MTLVEEMKNNVDDMISSYEIRVDYVRSVLKTTQELLEGFQDSFLDVKQEREKVITELRENLAKNESLRRSDFNNMMKDILSAQDMREREVKDLLNRYFDEHKKMAHKLSVNLGKFRSSLAGGEIQRIGGFQSMLKKILGKQEERKEEVISRLREFQKEQQDLVQRFRKLSKGRKEARISDFKSMLKELKKQKSERVACRKERREEVGKMLDDFKRRRLEAAKIEINHKNA